MKDDSTRRRPLPQVQSQGPATGSCHNIAKIIHKSMYLCLVLLPVTGLLIAAMFTQGITDGPMQDSILDLHGFSADLSYILIAIHIGAALYSRIKGEVQQVVEKFAISNLIISTSLSF